MSVPSPLAGLTEMVALTHTAPSSPMSDLGSLSGFGMIPTDLGLMRTMSDVLGFIPVLGDMRSESPEVLKATRPRRTHVLRDAVHPHAKHGFRNDPRIRPTVRSRINNQGTLPRYVRRTCFLRPKAHSPNTKCSTLLDYPGSFLAKLGLVRGICPCNAPSKSYPSLNVGLNPSRENSWEKMTTFSGQIPRDFLGDFPRKPHSVCPVRQIRDEEIARVLPGVLGESSVEC